VITEGSLEQGLRVRAPPDVHGLGAVLRRLQRAAPPGHPSGVRPHARALGVRRERRPPGDRPRFRADRPGGPTAGREPQRGRHRVRAGRLPLRRRRRRQFEGVRQRARLRGRLVRAERRRERTGREGEPARQRPPSRRRRPRWAKGVRGPAGQPARRRGRPS
jgi:hypothetical protein